MVARYTLGAVLLASMVLGGCGSHAHSAAPSAGQVASAFQGSPPALAALHAQPNQLLGGGVPAFDARLKALRGYPVVVNEWASWCGPCQSEFPTYQRVSVTYGRKVAFIGLDAKDADQAAGSFLRKFPVSYPSYVDRTGGIASWLHAFTAYPQTFYFDARGKMVYDKAGPYLSVQALKRDIRQYLHA